MPTITLHLPVMPGEECFVYDHRENARGECPGWVSGRLVKVTYSKNLQADGWKLTFMAEVKGTPFLYVNEDQIKQ